MGLDVIASGSALALRAEGGRCAVGCIQVYRVFPRAGLQVVFFGAVTSEMPSCSEPVG